MATKKTTGRVTPKGKGAPAAEEVTSASQWKKAAEGAPLRVPSGNVCLARNPGMQVFLQKNMIPNSLMPIVQKALSTGKAPEMDKLEVNEQTLEELMKLVDAVVIYCVIEPEIVSNLDEEGNLIHPRDRDPETLYVDEVDLEDKMFIFQWASGGTRDLQQFREQLAPNMGTVQAE